MRLAMSPERHAALFGPKEDLDCHQGRSRHCKSCGGWHPLDKPWPHNCRKEAPPRAPLATPQLAATFDAFRTGALEDAEIINDRREKHDYMERHGLAEWDDGVTNEEHWTAERKTEREIVADIKRFQETDPLALPPDLKAQKMDEAGCLNEGTEIDTSDIEVIK